MTERVGAASLLERQARWMSQRKLGLRVSEEGLVYTVGDGVAWVRGLPSAAMEEVVEFADGSQGLVFHLARERVGTVLLRQTPRLAAGVEVFLTGRRLSMPVGDALLGRVIDPLGNPLDDRGVPACTRRRPLDILSPPLLVRDFVSRPLYTGNRVIDTMIPIGRGQRQLILGDNGTGKTALALDTVLNQRGQDVRCVYVLIAQKSSTVVQVVETLEKFGALPYTTVVVAQATDLPGMKYLAPFAGCTAAEEWMWDGKDTLVVYDDLSTHARTFRELSLLLRRPPGREAYPADIFYLHARLLERATCLAAAHGGGSMTALPLVETKLGELATYVPTNLISITDGQVYLDRRLFSSGILPAIDVTRSVSRIGGRAQVPQIKAAAGKMKLDFLQFLELEVFTRFGSRLEAGVEQKIHRGRVLRELLKQERLAPVSIVCQFAWLTAFNSGAFDGKEPAEARPLLQRIERGLAAHPLTLATPREEWRAALDAWLAGKELP
jgi:F-type H+-transporting ATPase subunit alpha